MPEIVISEFMDEAAVQDLARDYDTLYDPDLADHPDQLIGLLAKARALIVRNRTQVRGDLLAAGTRLKAIGRLGVGLDNIDLGVCQARGIEVLPATHANDVAVAEYVIAGVMMLLRGAYQSSAEVAAGAWPRNALIGREILGKHLGLIGFGKIARRTAKRGIALGMTAYAYDPFVGPDDPAWAEIGVARMELDAVLGLADALSVHVPLTEATRHLIGPQAISHMKPDAVLINAARGGVVDEVALAEALREGRLGGAMLDVFETEPLPPESPLAGVPNLILTPHIAGVTEESNVRVSAVTADNVRHVLERKR